MIRHDVLKSQMGNLTATKPLVAHLNENQDWLLGNIAIAQGNPDEFISTGFSHSNCPLLVEIVDAGTNGSSVSLFVVNAQNGQRSILVDRSAALLDPITFGLVASDYILKLTIRN